MADGKRLDDTCHCGHERRVHDPCSTCRCSGFRPAERVKAKDYPERPVDRPEPAGVTRKLNRAARRALED